LDFSIHLADGRRLSYAENGDSKGTPIFFFHGTPSSRYLRNPDDSITEALGIRLITIYRPGFGQSEHPPNRKLLDWPDDVESLANALEIDQFAVAGFSGGGPYALACAYKLPHRITKAGVISGVGPTDLSVHIEDMYLERRLAISLARSLPWLLKPIIRIANNPQRNIEKYFQDVFKKSHAADQEILNRPEIKTLMKMNWLEGTRQGVGGFARDGIIIANQWGFNFEGIQSDVLMWHGDVDTSTPLVMAKFLAKHIPNCQLTIFHGEGHFLLFDHWEEIFTILASDK